MSDARTGLKKYTMNPPADKWLWKAEDETVFADVFPQKPNQPEDTLDDSSVRLGFVLSSQLRVD